MTVFSCCFWVFRYDLANTPAAFAVIVQICAVVGGHGIGKIRRILYAAGFIAGVHCQLSKTDIHAGYCHLRNGNSAQGRAACHICPVAVVLHRHTGFPADLAEDGSRQTVGCVALLSLEFHHHTAVHNGRIGAVSILGMVGVDGMTVIGRYHEGLGKPPAGIQRQRLTDPDDSALQEIGSSALIGTGANLLIIKYAQDGDVVRGLGIQEAASATPGTFQIVQCRSREELIL